MIAIAFCDDYNGYGTSFKTFGVDFSRFVSLIPVFVEVKRSCLNSYMYIFISMCITEHNRSMNF